jgi:predicted cupin superfamily sugar epimerase
MKAQDIIQQLALIEHPEGGFYKETYRCEMEMEFEGFNGKRNLGTSIYFLMLGGQSTLPHRIKSDEIWYYQYGSACEIIEISLININIIRIIKIILFRICFITCFIF